MRALPPTLGKALQLDSIELVYYFVLNKASRYIAVLTPNAKPLGFNVRTNELEVPQLPTVKAAVQDLTRSGLVALRNIFLPGTWGGQRLISCFYTPPPLTPATMGKQKSGYYAVRTGRVPGIYSSWAAAEEQVKGGRYST
jgi:hypothetical protein